MRVLKFGGTSVGNADRITGVAEIVHRATAASRVGVVVSAVGGVTNTLLASIDSVLADETVDIEPAVAAYREIHESVALGLEQNHPGADLRDARARIDAGAGEYRNLLRGIALVRVCPATARDAIATLGERTSVALVAVALRAHGLTVLEVDPCEVLVTDGVPGGATPDIAATHGRLAAARAASEQVVLLPGFFGGSADGKIATLGRGGSDWSAAILAVGLEAEALEIWTDVDGIYTADPRLVPDARVLPEVTYEEAMELSFFGAKVLHPRTMQPVYSARIPTWIRNTLQPDAPGTCIYADAPADGVRGMTLLTDIAMITVSGPVMQGAKGTAARVFDGVARAGVSVILITQGSSEFSISFCVRREDADLAVQGVEQSFALERQLQQVDPIDSRTDVAILSVVGDGMRARTGTAGTLFHGLASVDVNVVAIAQGSSERNISVVVRNEDRKIALRAAHEWFFGSAQRIHVVVAGATGQVGRSLLGQLAAQQAPLLARGIDLRVIAVTSSTRQALDLRGLDPAAWQASLDAGEPLDLPGMLEAIHAYRPHEPIFVDCTGSAEVADRYADAFRAGMHVVTASKLANTGTYASWTALRRTADRHRRRFLYETNVGAGLPVVDTMRNMVRSGDRVHAFSGILSGSLSYLLGELEEGTPLSEAVRRARELGFTEPDPRDDLSGTDVARKVLILSREAGLCFDLTDLEIEGVLPSDFDASGSVDDFLERLGSLDAAFADRVRRVRDAGRVLRFVGSLADEHCRVGLVELDLDHPLASIRGGENAVSFHTDRYRPIPLVVRGYGAGPEVTAAGVFGDVLRTVHWSTL